MTTKLRTKTFTYDVSAMESCGSIADNVGLYIRYSVFRDKGKKPLKFPVAFMFSKKDGTLLPHDLVFNYVAKIIAEDYQNTRSKQTQVEKIRIVSNLKPKRRLEAAIEVEFDDIEKKIDSTFGPADHQRELTLYELSQITRKVESALRGKQ